jgi:hypothetical protein
MHPLELPDDAQLLWVGFHPVWLLWGDPHLRATLEDDFFAGRGVSLTRIRETSHLDFIDGVNSVGAALDGLALASLDDEPGILQSVRAQIESTYSKRPSTIFDRLSQPQGKRWARWLIRRFRAQFGIEPPELEARTTRALQSLLAFGAQRKPREPDAISMARIEALYRVASMRPELSAGPVVGLGTYAGAGTRLGRHAMERLAQLNHVDATAQLFGFIANDSSVLRSQAAFAVSRACQRRELTPDLRRALFVLLEDEDPEVRTQAMHALVSFVAQGVEVPRLRRLAREIRKNEGHPLAEDLRDAVATWHRPDEEPRRSPVGFQQRMGLPR